MHLKLPGDEIPLATRILVQNGRWVGRGEPPKEIAANLPKKVTPKQESKPVHPWGGSGRTVARRRGDAPVGRMAKKG